MSEMRNGKVKLLSKILKFKWKKNQTPCSKYLFEFNQRVPTCKLRLWRGLFLTSLHERPISFDRYENLCQCIVLLTTLMSLCLHFLGAQHECRMVELFLEFTAAPQQQNYTSDNKAGILSASAILSKQWLI